VVGAGFGEGAVLIEEIPGYVVASNSLVFFASDDSPNRIKTKANAIV